MKRREFLKSSAFVASSATSLLWAPHSPMANAAVNTGHNQYFSRLNETLKRTGPGRPVMLIDTARMNHNIDRLVNSVGEEKTYRAVVKSLPSVPLLQHVTQRAKTDALMVFHQPFLNAVAQAFPKSDALLGKPMPVRAAETFYKTLPPNPAFNPAQQVQWLIDSEARLAQYLNLAKTLGIKIQVNFEIDVGLRRGGFASPDALRQALALAAANPMHLKVTGIMGYEPHLTGMQADLSHPEVQKVLARYHSAIAQLKTHGLKPENMTLNGAGSHTLKIYERDRTMNDLSAGSGVVMPTDFDTHHLVANRPALFIATPILKRYDQNPIVTDRKERLYYIYGGKWKARMVSPAETGEPLYESTNQSPITTPGESNLQVDDYMFLRPTQSEFVMLQFGDLLTVTDGEIDQRWPVFHETG
ncbi:MAG: DSD1 family PLP-dependent enzyme [Pseudomonadales bacterium]|nr:DSD1 family PLP-dependent enzyme [Pseudomonadales bacterium]